MPALRSLLQSVRARYRAFARPARRHFRPLYGALTLGTLVTLFALIVLQSMPIFHQVELNAYDFQFTRSNVVHIPTNIVVLPVNEQAAQALNDTKVPIPRRWYAAAIDVLRRAPAKAIGIDFDFRGPSSYGKQDDQALVAAMKRAGNVVTVNHLDMSVSNSVGAQVQTSNLIEPVPAIAQAAARLGVDDVSQDQDGAIRGQDLYWTDLIGQRHPSFALALASVALGKSPAQVARGLPNRLQINFGGDPQSAFLTPSFSALVQPFAPGENSPTPFKNKVVLIIPAYALSKDILQTPYGSDYGGYIQAAILNTILRRDPIIPAGNGVNSLVLLVVGLMTSLAASRFGMWRSAAAAVGVAVLFPVALAILFTRFHLWVQVVIPELTIVLVFAAIMAFRFATEERRRRRASRIFGHYVKPEIVEMLMSAPDEETALAGARRPVTVLFVDIRGFTAMSERMDPEQVVSALDVYLEQLTDSVQDFDGTVDKYVGDELMALWNAPRYQDNHALLAVLSAIDMVSRVDRINEQLRSKDLPAIRYGIGVNSGDAVVGQMGSSLRKQYTVIGDTVNTGARLCSAAAGSEIIIGQETWELIGDRLLVEETEPLRLKGKSASFRTFRVLGIKPELLGIPEPVPTPA